MKNKQTKSPIIIAHLIYRFDIGGLERVMVNCINCMNAKDNNEYKHVVISLTDISDFSKHLQNDVALYQLNKKPGKDLASHWRLFKLLRNIKPDILHTYNLAAIEYHLVAKLAGVKGNIHAEHGRDAADPQGLNSKHNKLRKFMSPMIDFIVPVSTDLSNWLLNTVNISVKKVQLIRNGINLEAFYRKKDDYQGVHFIHVARFDSVKDQANLINAFAETIKGQQLTSDEAKLTLVGDGQERDKLTQLVDRLGIEKYIVFTGARNDIPDLLATADVFVLSSIAEGIPMTVLEAMAANLPVISTNVGGLAELITENQNGYLVEKQNSQALSKAMRHYIETPSLIEKHGQQARLFIEEHFSENQMVNAYIDLYKKSLG